MKMRSLAIAPLLAVVLIGLVACGGGKSSNNNAATNAAATSMGAMNGAGMEKATVPNCGAVKAVWVNTNSRVYHEPGDPYYGRTKHGQYLCPSQAKAQGFHRSGVTGTVSP